MAFPGTSQGLKASLFSSGMGIGTVTWIIVVCYIRCDRDIAWSPYAGSSSTDFGKWTSLMFPLALPFLVSS
jgi:hypothetical protein